MWFLLIHAKFIVTPADEFLTVADINQFPAFIPNNFMVLEHEMYMVSLFMIAVALFLC